MKKKIQKKQMWKSQKREKYSINGRSFILFVTKIEKKHQIQSRFSSH